MRRLFRNFRLFDGLSDYLQDGKAIFVNEGRIIKIADDEPTNAVPGWTGTANENADACEIVDLNGYTLLPGFIDNHVHITVPLMNEFRGKDDIMAMQKQRELNFQSCIKYGITTVRDMGAFPDSIQEWKRRINSGEAIGPRIYTPNTFITTKDGPPERFPHIPFPACGFFGGQLAERVSKPKEVRKIAIENIKKNADFLKTQYARESMFFRGEIENLSDECFLELKRIAVQHGLKVAMHHTDNEGFRKGIEFRFDCLEHCSLERLDQRDIEEFVRLKMAIVPTLRVNHSCLELDEMLEWLQDKGKDDYVPESFRQIVKNLELCKRRPYPPDNKNVYLDVEKSIKGFDITLENVSRLKNAGAIIGAGSDSFGCYLNLPGFFWQELVLLTSVGLGNFEVLQAATIVNARILGIENEVGSIETGKFADFTVIKGNPLENIGCTRDVQMTIKNGEIYKRGNLG